MKRKKHLTETSSDIVENDDISISFKKGLTTPLGISNKELQEIIESSLEAQNDLNQVAAFLGIEFDELKELVEQIYGKSWSSVEKRGNLRGLARFNNLLWSECKNKNSNCFKLFMQKNNLITMTHSYSIQDNRPSEAEVFLDIPDNQRD